VTLRRSYGSAREAETMRAALSADQGAFVRAKRAGRTLTFRVLAEAPASARATLEDLLACLAAAERTAGLTVGPHDRTGRRARR
jgi:hypothetical protein